MDMVNCLGWSLGFGLRNLLSDSLVLSEKNNFRIYRERIWRFFCLYMEIQKNSNGRYSVYGYEPTEIRTKKSLSEMNNERVHTCGHEVPEDTIKLFIQLTIIINVNKIMGKKLFPLLRYLHWTENLQRHNLLH